MSDLRRLAGLGGLALILAGCGTTSRSDLFRHHFGIRPDEPKIVTTDTCAEYIEYAGYAQQLLEAYHLRATQNRWWI